ncbi:MAG TPA: Ldh family oxidoreductase, partial [Acidimicrobiia bacterium]|nr:Ldh family oxidoreductase [Acidimicrobiia bacterium]
FAPERLAEFAAAALRAAGVSEVEASVTADRLIEADLRGRTGHGMIRLPSYIERIQAGAINLTPNLKIRHETATSALVDGDNGLGQVVMTRATELAIDKAKASGLAMVGTVHSNHAGAAGVYTAMALRHDLAALYFAVANANGLAPWGGRERLLGTNPIAAAFPAGEEVPFQLDIATTVASHGSIRVKQLAGEPLPEGWVIDADGNPITDPLLVDEGFLMPIGGYKGSGLNIMIGALAGIMTGAAFGRSVVNFRHDLTTPTNTGQAIIVIRPDLFIPMDHYKHEMDRQLRELRASQSMTGEPVRLPGERATESEIEQRRSGIPVPASLITDLNTLAERLGMAARLAG